MKKFQSFFFLICLLIVSCSKETNSPDDPNGGGNPINTTSSIIFENNTFSGSCIVTYSDGTKLIDTFANGKMDIPATGSSKIIATIQPQNQQLIIIGRKEGNTIKLNYNGSVLAHRTAVNGFVPIGTFAEFQIINSNSTTLAASYKQEDTLYFMNNVWTPIGTDNSPFNGKFDGSNFKISGLNVVTNTQYAGLFGYGSSNSELLNIIVSSGSVKGGNSTIAAGIAGSCGIINNCNNYAKIESSYDAAGVVGDCKSITNPLNVSYR